MRAGFPSFPVLPRSHFEIFDGEAFPPDFINQDADPFLFQLYRRVGASRLLSPYEGALTNGVGGAHRNARYNEQHIEWSFNLLDTATATLQQWLCARQLARTAHQTLTLDVLIPTYRCNLAYLEPLVEVALGADGAIIQAADGFELSSHSAAAATAPAVAGGGGEQQHSEQGAGMQPQAHGSRVLSVHVVLVLDDPAKHAVFKQLQRRYEHDCRVRLRMQSRNTGASAARNRCLSESAAEWVLLLDDDVVASADIVHQYATAIAQWGSQSSGFVGSTTFPAAATARQRGVHIAGVTFFWGIADVVQPGCTVPWGPTANLCTRRVRGVRFALEYPKTGGGEDVAFCNDVSKGVGLPLRSMPSARAEHPYWNAGHPALSRFWSWAAGDGLLLDAYPELTYRAAPNVPELCLIALIGAAALSALQLAQSVPWQSLLRSGAIVLLSTALMVVVDLVMDAVALQQRVRAQRADDIPLLRANCSPQLSAVEVAHTALQAKLVAHASNLGRMRGQLQRGPACLVRNIGRRYMWWGALRTDIVAHEQRQAAQRCGLLCTAGASCAAILAALG